MENLFRKWISEILPVELDAEFPDASGFVAGMIFDAEQAGEYAFSAENFFTDRDRAEMCFPYQVPSAKLELKERKKNIIELMFLIHARDKHSANHAARIAELEEIIEDTDLSEFEMLLMQSRDWWNF